MINEIDFKEFHINKDGKKVAGTSHQVYKLTHLNSLVTTQVSETKLVDPFIFEPFVILV